MPRRSQTMEMPPAARAADVLVVGGGINGAGIARDLAGRGAAVVLVEQDDLAMHTSSASTKLIHGGLRYLEHGEFGLVRKALAEREVLLRSAPHIMRPRRFVMPQDASMRPAWLIRAGLFLYDHLAQREVLPGSRGIDLRRHPAGAPLKASYVRGFAYSDVCVDDARLVVLCAVDAAERGATIRTRCRCVGAEAAGGVWRVLLRHRDGREEALAARALVNAAGPWAGAFLRDCVGRAGAPSPRLVKGSHIVVPRLFDHDDAYIFQNPDGRVTFAIPYEGAFTLIGTTDVDHAGDPRDVRIDAGETRYLCEQASRYFARAVVPHDVVWSYSGVRPLLDDEASDPSKVTRGYQIAFDDGEAPLLSVLGGKLTTFRRLAEEAADLLCGRLGIAGGPWTEGAYLPGGDLGARIEAEGDPARDFLKFEQSLVQVRDDLPPSLLRRWARAYGTCAYELLDDPEGLGAEVAPGLYEAELRYLHDREWARCADDVLWRRSKRGLHCDAADCERVERWWRKRYANLPAVGVP